MQNSEAKIQALILSKIGSRSDVRLFRNSVGNGFSGVLLKYENGVATIANARRQNFGLCPGSADLIGLQKIIITPDMVGQSIAKFVSIEVKSERGKLLEAQANWKRMVENMGGYAVVARDLEDVGI